MNQRKIVRRNLFSIKPSIRFLSGLSFRTKKVFSNKSIAALSLCLGVVLVAHAVTVFTSVVKFTPSSVTVTPESDLPNEVQTLEARTVGAAFDRDTTTSYTAYGKSLVRVTFDASEPVSLLKVFGPAPDLASVAVDNGDGTTTPIPGWQTLNLANLAADAWAAFPLSSPVTAQALVIALTPQAGGSGTGIQEMEFWGQGPVWNMNGSLWVPAFQASQSVSPGGREYDGKPDEVLVGPQSNGANATAVNSFLVNLDHRGTDFRRAWLVYELNGFSHWIAPLRSINGQPDTGGWPMPGAGQWQAQVEEINPQLLQQGANTIAFDMPSGASLGYQVRNLKVVGQLDTGANIISSITVSTGDGSLMLDGDETTGWSPWLKYSGGANPTMTLNFDRPTQVDDLQLDLQGSLKGQIKVSALSNGNWSNLGAGVQGSSLGTGWQSVRVKTSSMVDAVQLTFLNGSGSQAQIMEAVAFGSGSGKPYGRTITVTYPDAGQFFGRVAYVRGFLGEVDNGSGVAQVVVGANPVSLNGGAFEAVISKDDAGFSSSADGDPWSFNITVLYPDGSQVVKKVSLTQELGATSGIQGSVSGGTYGTNLKPGQPVSVTVSGAQLLVPNSAVTSAISLQALPLKDMDLPALDSGMVNVTAGPWRGYRFLPHGTHFAQAVTLSIPYDPDLIPGGSTEQDVRTYYFDTEQGRWIALPQASLDTVNHKILSLTDHFTDFVNATITVPDHPQETSFNPTQLKDIKAADPGAGVNLIEPPQVNNNGTANLSYPIEVPPGRKGLQPQFSVAYNSGGGNGWMGVGWDLAIQNITVETRWGVPRYDGTNETETYLLNGEMLTEDLGPSNHSYLAHRLAGFAPRVDGSSTPVTFHTRKEGAFQLILRHGNSPAKYWWEVVEKNGMRSFFGGNPDTGGTPNPGSVLADVHGNIFEWALSEMKDLHGNSMHYNYDVVSTVRGSDTLGTEIYYNNCTYTGTNGSAGPYKVQFFHGQGTYVSNGVTIAAQSRPDVQLGARGGFPRATGDVLDHISVQLNGAEIRSYKFVYTLGAFQKTLLQSIQQLGPNGEVFAGNTHSFKYFNDVQTGPDPNAYSGFSTAGGSGVTTGIASSAIQDLSLTLLDGKARDLGSEDSFSLGGHIYVGWAPPGDASKYLSFGFKVGVNGGIATGRVQFTDINGDGLPDIVVKQDDGSIIYYPNLGGNFGAFSFGAPQTVTGIGDISKSNNLMFSFGPEVYVVANLLFNHSDSFFNQTTYLADVNGDGVPDLVSDGTVFFGHADRDASGKVISVTFSGDSSQTANPLCAGGAVQGSAVVPVSIFADQFNEAVTQDPLVDTVKQWTAPFTGTITINAPVTLASSAGLSSDSSADGVRVLVEKAKGIFPASGGNTNLATVDIPVTAAGTPQAINLTTTVTKGDRIYFRLQSIFDGKFDLVQWDPVIQYTSIKGVSVTGAIPDANNLDVAAYQASKDFTLAGRRGIVVNVPNTGTVTFGGNFNKGATSDDVTVLVNRIVTFTDNNPAPVTTSLFSQLIPAATTSSGPLAISPAPVTMNVTAGGKEMDQLQFLVTTSSNIDLSQIQWAPVAGYSSIVPPGPTSTPTTPSTPAIVKAPYDILFYPENGLDSPQVPFAAPASTVVFTPGLLLSSGKGTVVLTVKSGGALLGKQAYDLTAGTTVTSPTLTVTGLSMGQPLFVNLTAQDEATRTHLTIAAVSFSKTAVPFSLDSPGQPVTFLPSAYRGWSYVGLKANGPLNGNTDSTNGASVSAPITESTAFQLPSAPPKPQDTPTQSDKDALQNFQNSLNVVIFYPDPDKGVWAGSTTEIYDAPASMESSRFVMDTIKVAFDPSQLPGAPGGGSGGVACGSGAVGVPRVSHSNQDTLGVGLSFLSGSGSVGMGSQGILDFVDLNGDGYPDITGQDAVQYTLPTGGLEANARSGVMDGTLRDSGGSALNLGIGGNPANLFHGSEDETKSSGSQMSNIGMVVSGGVGTSENDKNHELIDINGDGLPDKVRIDGNHIKVSLNLGYGFGPERDWTQGAAGATVINQTTSNTIDGGLGFNDGIYGYGGGLNGTQGNSSTPLQLIDINGDGLPDAVQDIGNGSYQVWMNTGSGFLSNPITWSGGANHDLFEGQSQSVGLGGYFTIAITLGPYGTIIINPGADAATALNGTQAMLQDIKGDGTPDQLVSTTDGDLEVFENNWRRTNLLREVDRPLGATIQMEYTRDQNTYANPRNHWNITKVTVFDGGQNSNAAKGGADTQVTTYGYAVGVDNSGATISAYDRFEREFLGYGAVTETQMDTTQGGAGTTTPYRQIIRQFLNYNFYEKGLLTDELTQDSLGNPFLETQNQYQLADINHPGGGSVPLTTLSVQGLSSLALFPQLIQTDKHFFEGNLGTEISTHQTFGYDAVGNVTAFFDAGDPSVANSAVSAVVAYTASDPSFAPNYLMGLPTTIFVTDPTGAKVFRHREAVYDPNKGDLLAVKQFLLPGQSSFGTMAETDMTYDPNTGNMLTETAPPNLNNQRYQSSYQYDTAVNTYPVSVTDSSNYTSSMAYDFRFGKPVAQVDENGNRITTTYDDFGRTVTVLGPFEANGTVKSNYTIEFDYHPDAPVPYAHTAHFDVQHPDDPIETILFADGLKRVIQTKKDDAVRVGNGPQDVMVVSGRVVFDQGGRTLQQYYPVTEPKGAAFGGNTVFNPAYDTDSSGVAPTTMAYDILDRNTLTTIPDGTSTRTTYQIAPDGTGANRFLTQVTDAKGNLRDTFRDLRELITKVVEHNPAAAGQANIATSYQYDAIREVLRVTDNEGNQTQVAYDNLGRRTGIENPDTGLTTIAYDLASNAVSKQTADLKAENKAVTYNYDQNNRVVAVTYPDFPGNNVAYAYGAPGAANNGASRIIQVADEAGTVTKGYDALGNITAETRFLKVPQGNTMPTSYTTTYAYDTWSRMQGMVFPDGEQLTYHYDSGGNADAVTGVAGALTFPYVTSVQYDKFEQRAFVQNGNGTASAYRYIPTNQRLLELTHSSSVDGTIADLNYTYDPVGNITDLLNNGVVAARNIGGPVTQHFDYDDLYRLTGASGDFKGFDPAAGESFESKYTLSMAYDDIHNILNKDQKVFGKHASGKDFAHDDKPTYNNDYAYGADPVGIFRPHAPLHIGGRTYSYDLNGNQTGFTQTGGPDRSIVWDEENRIQAIKDGGGDPLQDGVNFIYDDSGQRIMKAKGGEVTAYINQFFTVRQPHNSAGAALSKHVFIGNTRILSQVEHGMASFANSGSGGSGGSGGGTGFVTVTAPATVYSGADVNSRPLGTANTGDVLELLGTQSHGGTMVKVMFQGLVGFIPAADISSGGTPAHGGGGNNGGGAGASTSVLPQVQDDHFVFYYHADHLGSTGYITDREGKLSENIQYFPFGETWVEQRRGTSPFPDYLFSGKTLDTETGLYYYGSRYYDPRTSVWQSPDPVLSEYLPNAGNFEGDLVMGGYGSWKGRGKRIYRPLSLNVYAYAFQNPLIFTDPDGDRPLTPGEIALARSVFGDSINYSKTEIFADVDRAITNPFTKNIHMDKAALVDVSTQPLDDRATFIHEMTHVRQAQTVLGGMGLAVKAAVGHAWAYVKGFFIGLFTSKTIQQAVYDEDSKLYDFTSAKAQPLKEFGVEQQAQIVQKNYEKGELTKKGLPLGAEHVKAGQIMGQTKNFPKSFQ